MMTAYTATVTVRLKRGVLDPGAADEAAAAERADEMAERLLANPTIHDYEVNVEQSE